MDQILKEKHLKATKQRLAILEAIIKLNDDATIKNIKEFCHHQFDDSTIYRVINIFLEKKVISKNLNYNNETYYFIIDGHSHYITCIKCHHQEKLTNCPLDDMADYLENKKGYQIVDHNLNIKAICQKCQKK